MPPQLLDLMELSKCVLSGAALIVLRIALEKMPRATGILITRGPGCPSCRLPRAPVRKDPLVTTFLFS
jgi:hypothetical protein